MTAPGELLATAPGDVRWIVYVDDGAEWAAPYLRGRLVRHDAGGWWSANGNGSREALGDQDLDLLAGTAPEGMPIWPEVAELAPQEQDAGLFRRYTMAELFSLDRTFRWDIRGVLTRPTYGQVAGELKSLKTHVSLFLVHAFASGQPLFGRFEVEEPRPVLVYVGEGGRIPWTRLSERVAAAMGITDPAALSIAPTFDIAAIGSTRFEASLTRDLEEVRPGLVLIDPLYAYHPTKVSASQLHEEGPMLARLSARCVEAGASLLVVNHFNQTGTGTGLKRITQAGSGEWVDSWLLLSHRQPPDVESGRFRLLLDIGSRQWGGTRWDLDLNLGRFDADIGAHDGEITWVLNIHRDEVGDVVGPEAAVLDVLNDHPWELTKTQLAEKVGGNRGRARGAIDALLRRDRVVMRFVERAEGDRTVTRELYALADEPVPKSDQQGTG